jgi:DNA-directed RNA polymerase subunit RPC12/RpoP
MPPDDQEGLRVRCPYCHKVFMMRKKQPSSEAARIRVKCPNCGEDILLPGDVLARACKGGEKK